MSQLLYALSALLLASVAYWRGRKTGHAAGYREGHRDGWNAFADRLQTGRMRIPR